MVDVFVVIFEWKDRRGGCNSRCGRPVGYQIAKATVQVLAVEAKAVEICSVSHRLPRRYFCRSTLNVFSAAGLWMSRPHVRRRCSISIPPLGGRGARGRFS